jgi:hypothetical protein
MNSERFCGLALRALLELDLPAVGTGPAGEATSWT